MNELMLPNIYYCLIFIVSGVIVLHTLKRFRLRAAYIGTLSIYLLLLLYIPFYFGGNVMLKLVGDTLKSGVSTTFVHYSNETLSSPFPIVKAVSSGTAFLAVVSVIAAAVAAVCIIVRLYHYVRDMHLALAVACEDVQVKSCERIRYIKNDKNVYKRLLRLLN